MWHVTFCMSNVTLHMSHVICEMLILILGTFWTNFVFMCMLKSHMSHVACHMSYVKCLCWSLGHAEQFLFSCLCSNVALYGCKCQCGPISHMLTHLLTAINCAASGAYLAIFAHPPTRANCPLFNRVQYNVPSAHSTPALSLLPTWGDESTITQYYLPIQGYNLINEDNVVSNPSMIRKRNSPWLKKGCLTVAKQANPRRMAVKFSVRTIAIVALEKYKLEYSH